MGRTFSLIDTEHAQYQLNTKHTTKSELITLFHALNNFFDPPLVKTLTHHAGVKYHQSPKPKFLMEQNLTV